MAEMNPGQTWECEQKLPLPIGVSNYCLAASEYYYIDKTMMIKDFIDERPMVTLFTRPRRFGKTLNMDMLRTYFERSDKDTSVYFRDKKIWSCGQKYRDYQGRYPVIFLTFKDVKFDTWEETFAALRDILQKRHSGTKSYRTVKNVTDTAEKSMKGWSMAVQQRWNYLRHSLICPQCFTAIMMLRRLSSLMSMILPFNKGTVRTITTRLSGLCGIFFQEVLRTTVICHLGSSPAFCG